MATSIPLPIALGRFKQLPQRSNETWQGGLVRLPMWIANQDDPQGAPFRPTGALWVSLRTGLLHLAMADGGAAATPEFALRALIDFGLKEAKRLNGRPSIVEVRDAQLQRTLSETMAPLQTLVMQIDDLPAVTDALRSLETSTGDGLRHAGILEDTGVTVDQLRAFADAAAMFFRAAPWRHLTDEDLIIVKGAHVPKAMRHLSVLGNAGEQFGIAFFESRQDFERFYGSPGVLLPERAFGVTYGPIDNLPFADVDAWEDLGLPVEGPQGYPLAADLLRDGTMRRLEASELRAAEALLRVLAQTTEDELDSGSWSHEVHAGDGAVRVELTLPFLLEAERATAKRSPPAAMPRLAERAAVRMARVLAHQSFESPDDANAALERADADGLFEKDAESAAGRPLTPIEQAQELAYDALEATGRLRIKLARRALAASPDCADACVILGDASATLAEARDWYQRGVEAGARAMGADTDATREGKYWEQLETRPYMRARLALAQVVRVLGETSAAVDHYRALLRLNPNDNQGVRYPLLSILLEHGRHEEADRLLEEYEDDVQAMWPYARALRVFQSDGDGDRARRLLRHAVRVNPHVPEYLIDPDAIQSDRPPHFALRSREEAAVVAEHLHGCFTSTPGALAWIQRSAPRSGGRRGFRARKRSRRR